MLIFIALYLNFFILSATEYPACPVVEHYCCEHTPSIKYLYTKYSRPSGEEFASYFNYGWRLPRKIRFVDDKNLIQSPEFKYDNPSKLCRVTSTIENRTMRYSLQCTFPTQLAVYNTSLARDSELDRVFWTYASHPRNSNASFPSNSNCYSLMLPSRLVNGTAKAMCVIEPSVLPTERFTHLKSPLLIIYTFHVGCLALLCGWILLRKLYLRSVCKQDKLQDDQVSQIGIDNYFNAMTGNNLRDPIESMEQKGYTDSVLGYIVMYAWITLILVLNLLILALILENCNVLSLPFIRSNHKTMEMFLILWVLDAFWLAIVIIFHAKLPNLFRYISPLQHCDRVSFAQIDKNKSRICVGVVPRLSAFVRALRRKVITVSVHYTTEKDRYVEFRHFRYVYDDFAKKFVLGVVILPSNFQQLYTQGLAGLQQREVQRRLDIIGPNSIRVKMPSMLHSIVKEVFSVFYFYQLLCYYVWFFTNYTYMAIVNICVIAISAVINVLNTRNMLRSIVQITTFSCDIKVLRDGVWRIVSSLELVPGDVVQIVSNWEVPCDMILLKGSIVCDEAALTGETTPEQKFSIQYSIADYNGAYMAGGKNRKHFLYAGTRTLYSPQKEITAIVFSTRAHTSRGQLLQKILSQEKYFKFKYFQHLRLMIACLSVVGLASAYFVITFLIGQVAIGNEYSAFIFAIYMFSAVLNPLLPVALVFAQLHATKRLLSNGIYTLLPHCLAICGKIKVFCFDKTGTITTQGLHFRGCVPVQNATFTRENADLTSPFISQMMKAALASCHCLGSLAEDAQEMQVWKLLQWKSLHTLNENVSLTPSGGDFELEIIRYYEFDHNRRSMSVVVKEKRSQHHFIFCKGSFERIEEISTYESLPFDYKQRTNQLARSGFYVLGLSYRAVPKALVSDSREWKKFLGDRDAVERKLDFLGLLLFENDIKEDSKEVMTALRKGSIRPVMITGDNAMTSCFVARASGMVERHARMILADLRPDNGHLVWSDVDTETLYSTQQVEVLLAASEEANIELAVTGRAFTYLTEVGMIPRLLFSIRIFSRMTPSGKAECVKQIVRMGAITGMCGDGGNDCGALRAANVGIALTNSKTFFSAPFTANTQSLKCVMTLCLEGRGTLATLFASLKFIILYGLIGMGLRVVMYYNSVLIPQLAFLFLDGVVLIGFAYGITRCRPLKVLGKERPTSSLFGPSTMFSILGQVLVHILFLFRGIRYLTSQPWYCPFGPDHINLERFWELEENYLSTSLWILGCFQQMASGIACTLGSQFRRPLWHNVFQSLYCASVISFVAMLVIGEPTALSDAFRLASSTNIIGLPYIPLPQAFRLKLCLIGILNVVTCVLYEKVVILGIVRRYLRRKWHYDRISMKM